MIHETNQINKVASKMRLINRTENKQSIAYANTVDVGAYSLAH